MELGFRMKANRQQHFLIVTYPAPGNINPSLHLAKHLAQSTGALVTFSTTISGHLEMFPDLKNPNEEVEDGLITYIPFDGYEEGYESRYDDIKHFLLQFKLVGLRSLSTLIDKLSSRGRHVTYIIYTFMLYWAADIARTRGIPAAHYWIQPATVFAIYYHYFHGSDKILASESKGFSSTLKLPGLPLLQIRDLPSFLIATSTLDDASSTCFDHIMESILNLDREQTQQKRKVLVNTFNELEADSLSAIDNLDLIAIGPILQPFPEALESDAKPYMVWLNSKPEKSVVYVSFGSVVNLKREQMEEISKGLKASCRPCLWVVRKGSRHEGLELGGNGEDSIIVEWCSQVSVLSHPSVGCFVTHFGWNSTLESLICGVPTVGLPCWSDQSTNAMLAERLWGTGVRGDVNEEGILDGIELVRCIDLVMGAGERGEEIRRKAELWKEKAREAKSRGGSSNQNLRAFVDETAS